MTMNAISAGGQRYSTAKCGRKPPGLVQTWSRKGLPKTANSLRQLEERTNNSHNVPGTIAKSPKRIPQAPPWRIAAKTGHLPLSAFEKSTSNTATYKIGASNSETAYA